MLQPKSLGFAGEKADSATLSKRQGRKKLFFTSAAFAAVSVLVSCSSAIAKPNARSAEQASEAKDEKTGCNPDVKGTLRKDEIVVESKCIEGREFVLTDKGLIRLSEEPPAVDGDGTSIQKKSSWTDMSGFYSRGIVHWEASARACYFLLADRKLAVLPNDPKDDDGMMTEFPLPFGTRELSSDRMIYNSGLLAIAPIGHSAFLFPEWAGDKVFSVNLPAEKKDEGFFLSGRKSYSAGLM